MTIADVIKSWLGEMIIKYPWSMFKYEYSERYRSYLVCSYPESLINSCDEFYDDEFAFWDKVENDFPDETVLICSGEALFSCSEKALVFKNRQKVEIPETI